MQKLNYFNFDLQIEKVSDSFTVQVLESPAGQAAGKFSMPFSDLELENFLLRFGRPRTALRRMDTPEMDRAKSFGKRLYDAVFSGQVAQVFRASLNEVSQKEAGLRIRLRLHKAPELFDLPWEYLYDSTTERFIALSNRTPLVHYLDLPDRIAPLQVAPPLNILVMISAPTDYIQLDIEEEWNRLKQAVSGLESRGLLHLDLLENPTLPALQRKLRQKEYHIFHFIGHGGFNEDTQDGLLLLQDENGRGKPVSGRFLGTILHDHASLRLVVLNACEGARTSKVDPFAGTAQSLMQQGIPAVIGMQFDISDESAITLAHEFYSALSDGFPVDAALAESRKAIFAGGKELEWGAPVLNMRAPDGQIFSVAAARGANAALSSVKKARPLTEAQAERVRHWYAAADEAYWAGDWKVAFENFSAVAKVDPDYRDTAAKLEEARRQAELSSLYEQAQAAMGAEDWQLALTLLQELSAQDPEYRDVSARLDAVLTQKRISDQYGKASNTQPEISSLAPDPRRARDSQSLPKRADQKKKRAPVGQKSLFNRLTETPAGIAILLLGIFAIFAALGVVLSSVFQKPVEVSSQGMALIKGGDYQIGTGRTVTVTNFWIDQFKVTNDQYARFVAATKRASPDDWPGGKVTPEKENYPVLNVSFDTARAYCKWVGKRLPSEAEWEIAGRGPFHWSYPWGDQQSSATLPVDFNYPVGSAPTDRSFFEVYDLASNGEEWVDKPFTEVKRGEHVLRGNEGGSLEMLSHVNVVRADDVEAQKDAGFRCAADAANVKVAVDKTLYIDHDFEDLSTGWPEATTPDYIHNYYHNGWYHLEIHKPGMTIPVLHPALIPGGFIVDTESHVDPTTPNNEDGQFMYGVAVEINQSDFLAFVISAHTNEWQILRGTKPLQVPYETKDFTVLSAGKGSYIHGADVKEYDRLGMVVSDGLASFTINGKLVGQVYVSVPQTSRVGFIMLGQDKVTKIHSHFDWMKVRLINNGKARLADSGSTSNNLPTPGAETTVVAASVSTVESTETLTVPQTGLEATPTVPVPLPSGFQMVKVTGGKYTVGDQQNKQEVDLTDYWMDMYEVTNADYARFLNDVPGDPPSGWNGSTLPAGKEKEPVRGVKWDAAQAYCKWVDKRLPTEAEWEVAARGPAGFLYPWGNEPGSVQLPEGSVYPTGSIVENRSYFGLYDTAGNVWEWIDSPYAPAAGGERVIRGGSAWYMVDLTNRIAGDPNLDAMYSETGIRCAASQVDPSSDGFLIHDDGFREASQFWYQAEKPFGAYFFGIHPPDYYHVQVRAANSCVSVIRDSSLTDFLMEVKLFAVATDTETGEFFYGVTFREAENKFYAVVISPRTQTWSVLKHTAAGFALLDQAKDEELISPSLETHHRIFVAARGPDLTVFIDGKLVTRVSDKEYTSGAIGFVLRTKSETYTHVHYDSVDVWALPENSSAVQAAAGVAKEVKSSRQIVAPLCAGNVQSATLLKNYFIHYVKEGESWPTIADFYKMPVEKIYAANGRDPVKPGVLKPGNAIVIPQTGQ